MKYIRRLLLLLILPILVELTNSRCIDYTFGQGFTIMCYIEVFFIIFMQIGFKVLHLLFLFAGQLVNKQVHTPTPKEYEL